MSIKLRKIIPIKQKVMNEGKKEKDIMTGREIRRGIRVNNVHYTHIWIVKEHLMNRKV